MAAGSCGLPGQRLCPEPWRPPRLGYSRPEAWEGEAIAALGTIPDSLSPGCAGLHVVKEGDLAQALSVAQDLAAHLVPARAQEPERQLGRGVRHHFVSEVSPIATCPGSHRYVQPSVRAGCHVTGLLRRRQSCLICKGSDLNHATGWYGDARTSCGPVGFALPYPVPFASEPATGGLHRAIMFDTPFGPQSQSLSSTAYLRARESDRAIRPISVIFLLSRTHHRVRWRGTGPVRIVGANNGHGILVLAATE